MSVCRFLDRHSGGSNTVENASNAALKLWLSALSQDWQLLVALLSQFSDSDNHLVESGHFLCHEVKSRAYNNRAHCSALCCTCTNNSAVASTTVVRALPVYRPGLCSRNTI